MATIKESSDSIALISTTLQNLLTQIADSATPAVQNLVTKCRTEVSKLKPISESLTTHATDVSRTDVARSAPVFKSTATEPRVVKTAPHTTEPRAVNTTLHPADKRK